MGIRPLLEVRLRYQFPSQFLRNEWLGDFITRIRDADTSSPLFPAMPTLGELEAINDYSKKYHHDQNPGGCETEPITDAELQGFVKRTLDLVGGF